jgi:hypothetical protein
MTYIDHKEFGFRAGGEMRALDVSVSWPEYTYRRLAWLYGPERAHAIELGTDTRTNADLAAWRRLGDRKPS